MEQDMVKKIEERGQEAPPGLLRHRIENGHYVVDIKWRDGKETENHFPAIGFDVSDANGQIRGFMPGSVALEVLRENAGTYTCDEFDWRNFSRRLIKRKG